MFLDIALNNNLPAYIQVKDYIKAMILKGILQKGEKLPSTRELAIIIKTSRNTVISAYEYLVDEGFIITIIGKGSFVLDVNINIHDEWKLNWGKRVNEYCFNCEKLDIIKSESVWEKGMISFKSIAPDEKLFDTEGFKRAFLNRMSIEGAKILNYGYAAGYKPLIEYLFSYMKNKGVNIKGKRMLITNGFTEGFDIVVSALTESGDSIICENPTHNTAIKIMKLHGLKVVGVDMESDGINLYQLEKTIEKGKFKFAYLIPSYHNPTGIVMSPQKRIEVCRIFKKFNVPVIEDGFNEELRYSGSHVAPLAALSGNGNNVIYIGSFSKILFPGIRIGWVLGDETLISYLESIKRARTIHTSVLDQAVLFEYLSSGYFEKYLKKARRVYKRKYEIAYACAKKYIPAKHILGEGGLHIFVKLDGIDARLVLTKCIEKKVIFTPGDIFYTDERGFDTLRLGFSRVSNFDIEKGFKIIGDIVRSLS